MTQYLYLILCKADRDDGLYKIGIANDVESRLAQLQTGSPFELEIMECYEFGNSEIAERAIHQAYAKDRFRGEWFKLGFSAVEKFRKLCDMLGGTPYVLHGDVTPTIEEVEEAEEIQKEVFDNLDKWDYEKMFADGWRIEKTGKGKYWQWRERKHNGKTIYGGSVASLPFTIEGMRLKYEKGKSDETE